MSANLHAQIPLKDIAGPESKLLQAISEGIAGRQELTEKLHAQLAALEQTRALRNFARTQALARRVSALLSVVWPLALKLQKVGVSSLIYAPSH